MITDNPAKSCLIVLLLIGLAYYLTTLIVTLLLGYLFPWPSPTGEVLRVEAPEGEPFQIDWGIGAGTQRGEVPTGSEYVDHTIPTEIAESDDLFISIRAGSALTYVGQEEVNVGAILYVDGKYADCSESIDEVGVNWSSYEELGGTGVRVACGSYRWADLFPDPLSWVGL